VVLCYICITGYTQRGGRAETLLFTEGPAGHGTLNTLSLKQISHQESKFFQC